MRFSRPKKKAREKEGKKDEAEPVEKEAEAKDEDGDEEVEDYKVFVISLCDGMGGGLVAVTTKTARMRGHVVEKEEHLREFVCGKFPGATASTMVEAFDIEAVLAEVEKEDPDALMLIMGPPCQPFSLLATTPLGLDDPRCAALKSFVKIRDALDKGFSTRDARKFRWILEEVANMTAPHRDAISKLLGCQPVLVNAADWGWVQRARLYWGLLEH